jgi:hypothetical protein
MQSIALLRVQQERHPEVRAIHGTVALNSNAQSLAVRRVTCGASHVATAQVRSYPREALRLLAGGAACCWCW